MTIMPSDYTFQLARKRPKFTLLLALQVNTGDGFQTINRVEGVRPDERHLCMKLEVLRVHWRESNHFGGDAEYRIVEIEDDA